MDDWRRLPVLRKGEIDTSCLLGIYWLVLMKSSNLMVFVECLIFLYNNFPNFSFLGVSVSNISKERTYAFFSVSNFLTYCFFPVLFIPVWNSRLKAFGKKQENKISHSTVTNSCQKCPLKPDNFGNRVSFLQNHLMKIFAEEILMRTFNLKNKSWPNNF